MKNRASGFLEQRHAHHAASRLTWVKRWLKRAYRHHAQSRELERSPCILVTLGAACKGASDGAAGCRSRRAAVCTGEAGRRHERPGGRNSVAFSSRHEHAIEQPLELLGPFRNLPVPCGIDIACPKELVGDVQRREHGEAQRIT
jgi:hypothetical protein